MMYDRNIHVADMARPLGTNSEYERIIETDTYVDEYGRPDPEPDMFRLEYSGWTRYIEFMPKEAA